MRRSRSIHLETARYTSRISTQICPADRHLIWPRSRWEVSRWEVIASLPVFVDRCAFSQWLCCAVSLSQGEYRGLVSPSRLIFVKKAWPPRPWEPPFSGPMASVLRNFSQRFFSVCPSQRGQAMQLMHVIRSMRHGKLASCQRRQHVSQIRFGQSG